MMYLSKLVYNLNTNNNVKPREIFKVHEDLVNFLNRYSNPAINSVS